MKLSDVTVDQQIVEEGGWVSNIPGFGDVRLKCRGEGNKGWRRQMQVLLNAVPRKLRVPHLDPGEQDRINAILILNHGLIDWEGITDDNDNPLPYDKNKAAEFLKHEKFRDGAIYACRQVAEGIVDDVEAIAGN
jgi:hypothetical protein